MRDNSFNQFLGRAAEYRFVSELLLRDLQPMLSIVDQGVDVSLPSKITIQVKAGRKRAGQTTWKLSKWRIDNATRRFTAVRKSRTEPDFYAFWAVDDDRWFIVPSVIVRDQNAAWINNSKATVVTPYEGRWDLFQEGGRE